YTGPYDNLIEVTGSFLKWAGEKGVKFQKSPSKKGDEWVSRLEFYIKDPGNEQDPTKYETELAFLTRDPQS
ncbi:MAG: GyrI-like domain-containing protein, partial [Chloroflexia bacterium]